MHMADALISPAVGIVCIGTAAVCTAISLKNLRREDSMTISQSTSSMPALSGRIPLMGIMAAFVFAAQMINFTIPGTGSSGHIGGGLLLAAVLGPWAGFLSMTSVLLIQAFFFADGGLLALGANIMNMGFFTCFLAYPLLFKPLLGKKQDSMPSQKRILFSSTISVVTALQLGAFSVVLQTLLSGKTTLPFGTFVLYMQPIHFAIGFVEGLVTAAVLGFVMQYQPDLLACISGRTQSKKNSNPWKWIPAALICTSLLIGGIASWYASGLPDGLEWSVGKTSGTAELDADTTVHDKLAAMQEKTAILPDYGFRGGTDEKSRLGTSLSGLLGILLSVVLMIFFGIGLRILRKKKIS